MKNILQVFLFLLIFSCGQSEPAADCDVPNPEAIFSKEIKEVQAHKFSLKDHLAKEEMSFSNGVQLEIFQSGCDKIIQEFIFDVPTNLIDSQVHTQHAIQQLKYISSLDVKYLAFNQWADAIKKLEPAFFESKEVEVAPGFNVALDSVKGSNGYKVIIRLSQS